jgi:hypothetical protein
LIYIDSKNFAVLGLEPQVRCAGFNGKLGSSFGQLFQAVDPASKLAMAA